MSWSSDSRRESRHQRGQNGVLNCPAGASTQVVEFGDAQPPRSLRGRLARWIAIVLGVSLVSSSALRLFAERLFSHSLQLPEGTFELRYGVNEAYVSAATRRALLFQTVNSAVVFLLIMAGVEWILRRRLREPLHELAHQLDHMRAGGGWLPVLPPTDAECAEIACAIRELGPGLAGQVETWIEGEKRAAVATAFGRLRKTLFDLREPLDPNRDGDGRTTGEVDMLRIERLIDFVESDALDLNITRRSVRPGSASVAPPS